MFIVTQEIHIVIVQVIGIKCELGEHSPRKSRPEDIDPYYETEYLLDSFSWFMSTTD